MVEKNYTKFNFKNSRQKGKTILKARNKKCVGCDEFIDQKSEFPVIEKTQTREFLVKILRIK